MSRREARRRAPPRRPTQSVGPIILGFVGILILVVGGGFGIWLNLGAKSLDRDTGCPSDRYDSVTAVLVDLTDGLSPVQSAALRNALMAVRDEIPKYGRLEIYPLESTKQQVIQPLYVGCNPGSARDVSSEITGNRQLADKLWNQEFGSKVDAVLDRLGKIEPQDNSPLLEGIQSVAITAFGTPKARDAGNKRLVIVSDMLHNTPEFTLYKGAPDFQAVSAGQYLHQTRPDLHSTIVDIYLIVRNTRRNAQQPPLYKFWVDFFHYGDGFLRHWVPLQ